MTRHNVKQTCCDCASENADDGREVVVSVTLDGKVTTTPFT